MAQIQIKDASGAVVTTAKVDNTGQTTRTNSLPVVMASEDATLLTFTKGGGAIDANTQRVTLATDGPGISALNSLDTKTPALVNGLTPVESLGTPLVSRQLTAGSTNTNTVLTSTCRRISIRCRFADARFTIGTSAQTASSTTSHYIGADERLDFAIPANAQIGYIRDSLAS
jgi:hypothetical protein